MRIRQYEVKLRHDRGVVAVTIAAQDASSAIDRVCLIERAPRRAVLSVTDKEQDHVTN